MSTKAPPSRQSHACTVCGKVYSRSEYVRRHYIAKHQPKLPCPETGCESSFARQDLLIRHIKIFHPNRDAPLPQELADHLDPPLPLPLHQGSMDSNSSWNSQASSNPHTPVDLSLLGGPIANSPELLPRQLASDLPTPPEASTSSGIRRSATFPLPLSLNTMPLSTMPYSPYPIPSNFGSLPPSTYAQPQPQPPPASNLFLPYSSHSLSSSGTIRGRSHTLGVPGSTYSSDTTTAGAPSLELRTPTSASYPRPNMVDADTQTDLRAAQIPDFLLQQLQFPSYPAFAQPLPPPLLFAQPQPHPPPPPQQSQPRPPRQDSLYALQQPHQQQQRQHSPQGMQVDPHQQQHQQISPPTYYHPSQSYPQLSQLHVTAPSPFSLDDALQPFSFSTSASSFSPDSMSSSSVNQLSPSSMSSSSHMH